LGGNRDGGSVVARSTIEKKKCPRLNSGPISGDLNPYDPFFKSGPALTGETEKRKNH